jgi:nicotinamide-nucleotide amidase
VTTAAICTIGDELLAGETVDTNSAWMATALGEIGIEVRVAVTVGDDLDGLTAEVRRLAAEHDVLLCSGGLGPTSDDRTREAVAAAAGVELVRDEELGERLRRWFAERGVDMPEANLRQADAPAGATVLPPQGTAAGFLLEVGGCLVAALPGPPWELHAMFDEDVEPHLLELPGARPQVTRVVRVGGMGESAVAECLAPVEAALPAGVGIAYLASGGEIRVKLSARGATRDEARDATEEPLGRAVELLGTAVVAVDGGPVEETVVRRYAAEGRTVAVAESASAGMVADRLASVPGASAVLLGGAVAYSAAAKVSLCGVDPAVIDEHGTVARATTEAMATGIRERLGADVGVATTGVAGPDPVGDVPVGTLVWAVATAGGVQSWQRALPGDRAQVRRRLAAAALEALRRH